MNKQTPKWKQVTEGMIRDFEAEISALTKEVMESRVHHEVSAATAKVGYLRSQIKTLKRFIERMES